MGHHNDKAPIDTFTQYQDELDAILKQLSELNQQRFHLEPNTITQNHCLELWYHTRLIEDIIANAFSKQSPKGKTE